MRELTVVGLDVDGKSIICQGADAADVFKLRLDDRLRAALQGNARKIVHTEREDRDFKTTHPLTPREIQARIRAGASAEEVAAASGNDITRVQRFAHPVLLERSRAAELATAAHPILADGPTSSTLLETISAAFDARGLNPGSLEWDAWRTEDSRWKVQLAWQAGLSDNIAHFRFIPGAHGGTVSPIDDTARELIDPDFDRPLRSLAPVAQLDFAEPALPEPAAPPEQPISERRAKPTIPAWEDVLLGVRSTGQR